MPVGTLYFVYAPFNCDIDDALDNLLHNIQDNSSNVGVERYWGHDLLDIGKWVLREEGYLMH